MNVKLCSKELKVALKKLREVKGDSRLPSSDLFKFAISNGKLIVTKSSMVIGVAILDIDEVINNDINPILVDEKTIKLILKLEDGQIHITSESMQIRNKRIKFINQTGEVKNPIDFEYNHDFEVEEKELFRMLEVSFATAKDEARPVLQGINFKGGKTCALDGYRLSIRETNQFNYDGEFTINKHCIHTLKRILNKNSEEMIKVSNIGNGFIIFEKDNFKVIGRLLEADFIKYESLIPNNFNYELNVDIKELITELKLLKEVSSDNSNFIITILEKDNQVIIESESKLNNMEITLEKARFTQKEKDGFYISLNAKYLLEALNSRKMNKDTIEFKMSSKISPIIITDNNKDLELILPIRLEKGKKGDD